MACGLSQVTSQPELDWLGSLLNTPSPLLSLASPKRFMDQLLLGCRRLLLLRPREKKVKGQPMVF